MVHEWTARSLPHFEPNLKSLSSVKTSGQVYKYQYARNKQIEPGGVLSSETPGLL